MPEHTLDGAFRRHGEEEVSDEDEQPAMATHLPRLLSLFPPVQTWTEKCGWDLSRKITSCVQSDAFTHAAETKTSVAILGDEVHGMEVLHKGAEGLKLHKPASAMRKLNATQAVFSKFGHPGQTVLNVLPCDEP